MRVVAFTTVDFAPVQIKMRRREIRVVTVMAYKTQSRNILRQQGGKLRSMRRVTIETTALGHRRMRLAVGQLLLEVGMTDKAKAFRFIQQKPRQGRKMGLMAAGAGAVGSRPVNTPQSGCIRGQNIMALGAYVFLFSRQQAFIDGGMGQMAQITLSLGERLMDDSVSLLGHQGGMAGLAQFGARLL